MVIQLNGKVITAGAFKPIKKQLDDRSNWRYDVSHE